MRVIQSSTDTRLERLRGCPLFAGLPADGLRELAGIVALRVYEPGEAIFAERDPADGFLVPVQGTVRVCRHSAEGREQVLHILGPGEPCGEVPVFQGGRYPATALAQETLRALWVPRAGFLEIGRHHPDLLLGMLAVLSRRLRGFVDLIDDLSLSEVSARLARHLLRRLDEKDDKDQKDERDRRGEGRGETRTTTRQAGRDGTPQGAKGGALQTAKDGTPQRAKAGAPQGGKAGARNADDAQTVVLESTKAVLASRIGTVAETLSRTLQRMQKDRILRVEGKALTVLDRPRLEALAEGGRRK